MPPSLPRLAGDLLALYQGFLLPRRRWRGRVWFRLLPCAISASLGAAATGIGLAALLVERLVGAQRFEALFPYLGTALELFRTGGHSLLAPLIAAAGLGLLAVQLVRLAPPLRRRWLALTALLALLVLSTAVDVAFTEGNGAVMDALNARDAVAFWGTALGLIAIYLITLPLQYLTSYGQQRFALAWRDAGTTTMVSGYLRDRAYYRLESDAELAGRIDNPDQRLADDIGSSVFSATDLAFGFCASLLSLAAYLLVLLGLGPLLVLTLLAATLLGNAVILRLVRRLTGLSVRQQALEADYRYALVHVRAHAESLAFLRGELPVGLLLQRRFQRLIQNLERLIRWRTLLEQSSGLYGFLMQFVPYLVLSAAYFGGRVSLGQLTVASLAFGQVQTSLSFLIDRADSFAALFASVARISDLGSVVGSGLETTAPLPPERPGDLASKPSPAAEQNSGPAQTGRPELGPMPGTAPLLRLRGLRVNHPARAQPLLDGLDLELGPGERLLITGPSGCGKTMLLRVLAGLQAPGGGGIAWATAPSLMVLPQKPYLPLGSLREQLLFPSICSPDPKDAAAQPHARAMGRGGFRSDPSPAAPDRCIPDDAQLRQVLERVHLEELAQRHPDLSVEDDWERVLSGGEQQRLAVARLLLQQALQLQTPQLVLLDEATSALDAANEAHLYGLLIASGAALLSVGHRPGLRAFHQRELRLDGQGSWSLQALT